MRGKFRIISQIHAKPLKKFNPLTECPTLRKIRIQVEASRPRTLGLKKQILKLLKDPEVQKKIQSRSFEDIFGEVLESTVNFRTFYYDQAELFFIGQVIADLPFENEPHDGLSRLGLDLVSFNSSEQIELFFEKLFSFIRTKEWADLEPKVQADLLEEFGYLFRDSSEGALTFFQMFLDLSKEPGWKELTATQKSSIIGGIRTVNLTYSKESGELYLSALTKVFRNGISLLGTDSFAISGLSARIIQEYSQRIDSLDLNCFNGFQMILIDLARADPHAFFYDSESTFRGISKIQFDSLCSELAKVNPELVERVGQKLEQTIWRNAA